MGDFDVKLKSERSAESRKVAILAVLGVVLAGVLGYHFFGRGAQVAEASNPGVAVAVSPTSTADLTPQAVRDALRDDPTALLLLSTNHSDPSLEKTPRNPFRMSAEMRSSLLKTVEPTQPEPVRVENPTPRIDIGPAPRVASPTLRAEDFKLSTIVTTGDKLMAIVNSTILATGSVVNNARVVEIRQDRVILQHINSTDGAKLELLLDRPRK